MALAMARPWKHPKTGIFGLRKRIPVDLRPVIGKREEKQSLGTRDPNGAKRIHAQALAELAERWANLRSGPKALSEREAHELVAPAYEWWVNAHRDNPSDQKMWRTARFGELWSYHDSSKYTELSFAEQNRRLDEDGYFKTIPGQTREITVQTSVSKPEKREITVQTSVSELEKREITVQTSTVTEEVRVQYQVLESPSSPEFLQFLKTTLDNMEATEAYLSKPLVGLSKAAQNRATHMAETLHEASDELLNVIADFKKLAAPGGEERIDQAVASECVTFHHMHGIGIQNRKLSRLNGWPSRGPHGQPRMTRGRCGSLLLHRKGLAPSTPYRSPGASHMFSVLPPIAAGSVSCRHLRPAP
jgi:hypothetical protein